MRTINTLALTLLVALPPVASAQFCDGPDAYIVGNPGPNWMFVCDTSVASFTDDFPCKDIEQGEIGTLGWSLIANVVGTSCGGSLLHTGAQSIVPSAGNTPSGIRLAPNGDKSLIGNPATNVWSFQARVKIAADLDEVVYKIGIGDKTASETVNHTAANQDFVGVIFKDEDSDSGGECGGTTGGQRELAVSHRQGRRLRWTSGLGHYGSHELVAMDSGAS